MLEKPDLDDAKIVAHLSAHYGIHAAHAEFLPLGADASTAVYRVDAADETRYFLKLRRGAFDAMAVTLPRFLHDQGVPHLIPPLPTGNGALWSPLDVFTAILYPFVEGRDGYETSLNERQWIDLGAAFRRIHITALPPALAAVIPRETYSRYWRECVRAFQAQVERESFADPISATLAALLRSQRELIGDLVARAERLGGLLQARQPDRVICHADMHAGNLLICADGAFYIVDWDTLILGPKERDLMYVGGGLMANWLTPPEEEALFYRGYGATEIDSAALAYYRYERIVQDIAAYCAQIFGAEMGDQDRAEGLRQLTGQFETNGVIAIAYQSDRTPQSSD